MAQPPMVPRTKAHVRPLMYAALMMFDRISAAFRRAVAMVPAVICEASSIDGADGIGRQLSCEYAVSIDVGQLVRPAFRIGFRSDSIRHGTRIRTGFLGVGDRAVQRSGQCRNFTVSVFAGLRDGFAFLGIGIALGTAPMRCPLYFAR